MDIAADSELSARRKRLLGPTYGLFYERPLHVVRAEGVWMHDAHGRTYLDAYNNVPVVGHGHPRVVEALVAQSRTLNTHTRYITDQPLMLAEKLLATLPDAIDHTIFTCTGSEANDLAVRIARQVTGGNGIIITERAYHGNTTTIAGMSPSGRQPLGPDVFTVPAPSGDSTAVAFGQAVRSCIARMQAEGVQPAAMLVDTILSSDGIFADPPGFLEAAAREIRAAGGLFIADEVQAGFARMGETMWGFARHGVVPDIVTMGKPMGNGHPIGCLAARGPLLQAFSERRRYFNTFGGNPVSCAVGAAVLDVIAEEGLQQNALMVGKRLREGLEALATEHALLGAVRGVGLYYGVDVHPGPFGNSGRAAAAIVNGLVRNGVLIGATGHDGGCLKIRPPLVFSAENAAFFLERMQRTLRMLPAIDRAAV